MEDVLQIFEKIYILHIDKRVKKFKFEHQNFCNKRDVSKSYNTLMLLFMTSTLKSPKDNFYNAQIKKVVSH